MEKMEYETSLSPACDNNGNPIYFYGTHVNNGNELIIHSKIMNKQEYTYEDDIRITSELLDKIDIEQYFFPEEGRDTQVHEVMSMLEDNVDPKLLNNDFFEGILFNRMCEEEFIDYLNKRYEKDIKIEEVHTNYIYKKNHRW